MARIPLVQRTPQLNSGNAALIPTAIQSPTSGLSEGLKTASNALGQLSARLQSARDVNELSDLSIQLRNRSSEFSNKVQNEYYNNPEEWDNLANNYVNEINEIYNNKKLSPEAKMRANEEISRWSTNLLIESNSLKLKREGENFDSNYKAAIQMGEIDRNYNMAKNVLALGASKNLIPKEQLQFQTEMLNIGENKFMVEDWKNNFQSALESNNFGEAERLLNEGVKNKLIPESQKDLLETTIRYKNRYNQTAEEMSLRANEEPNIINSRISVKNFTISELRGKRTTGTTTIPELKDARSSFIEEARNPVIMEQLLSLAESEVGSQGREAQIAFLETALNRATVEGRSLKSIINDSNYYQPLKTGGTIEKSRQKIRTDQTRRRELLDSLSFVLDGSNLTGGATDNASADVASKVLKGGYDSVPESIINIGGETFYTKTYYDKGERSDGSLSPINLSENDKTKIRQQSASNIERLGVEEFNNIKNLVTIGSINSSDSLEEVLINSSNMTPIMKDSARFFYETKFGSKRPDNPETFERSFQEVTEFIKKSETLTPEELIIQRANLSSKIESQFTGSMQTELKNMLSATANRNIGALSSALKSLNEFAYEKNGFGAYKTPQEALFRKNWHGKLIPITEEEAKLLPSEEIIKGELTGKPKEAIVTVDGKKKEIEIPGGVIYNENPLLKQTVDENVSKVRDQLIQELKSGVIRNSEEAEKRMRELYIEYNGSVRVLYSGKKASMTQTPIDINKLDTPDKIRDAIKIIDVQISNMTNPVERAQAEKDKQAHYEKLRQLTR